MRVLHVPFGFFPDAVGGTEVYVASLGRCLEACGVATVVAAPGPRSSDYVHAGLRVRRFKTADTIRDLRVLYGVGDDVAAREFDRVLDDERPDVVHLHAFTPAVSLRVVHAAKRRGIAVVFTYHTPTVTCSRGTLMRWGADACDGILDARTCAACTLHSHGIGRHVSGALARLPAGIGSLVAGLGVSGKAATALRTSELVRVRHDSIRHLLDEVDRIVVLCDWTRDLLVRNRVPSGKIVVSRHGLPAPSDTVDRCHRPSQDGVVRIAFLGRLDPTKGPDLLIRSVRELTGLPITLHLFGIVQSASGDVYRKHLESLSAGDPRIAFSPSVSADRVPEILAACDVLAVPSRLLETGPLVVLEAFAAGVPVIGARLGGIAELVTDGVDGVLLDPDSVPAWTSALRAIVEDRSVLERLRKGIRRPRRVEDVAEDMIKVYRDVAATIGERFAGASL